MEPPVPGNGTEREREADLRLNTERTREFAMTLRQSPDQRLWSAKYPAPDRSRLYRSAQLRPGLSAGHLQAQQVSLAGTMQARRSAPDSTGQFSWDHAGQQVTSRLYTLQVSSAGTMQVSRSPSGSTGQLS